jgi:hypothetical protein
MSDIHIGAPFSELCSLTKIPGVPKVRTNALITENSPKVPKV